MTLTLRVSDPVNIVGNSDQLYRLFSNLIINAIQYTASGGKVTVYLDHSDHYAVIQIEDTGIGIPQQELSRIFDRFYRVNSDRSRSTGGSGLGLAISQAIVQAHHGSLNVQSELGKGTTFTVKLPFNVRPLNSVRYIYLKCDTLLASMSRRSPMQWLVSAYLFKWKNPWMGIRTNESK